MDTRRDAGTNWDRERKRCLFSDCLVWLHLSKLSTSKKAYEQKILHAKLSTNIGF